MPAIKNIEFILLAYLMLMKAAHEAEGFSEIPCAVKAQVINLTIVKIQCNQTCENKGLPDTTPCLVTCPKTWFATHSEYRTCYLCGTCSHGQCINSTTNSRRQQCSYKQ
uniref:Secreted peptide n=1 Tax=Rhipicephalus pulchellus TaxID=72859 RepID=L7LVW2_RHIPC